MRCALAIAALGLGLAGTAAAAPITPPPGWSADPQLATAPQVPRFGGVPTTVAVFAYRAPVAGAVLYVDRAEAELPADRRDALATAELEELRNVMRRQGASAKAEASIQRFDPKAKLLEGALTWRDPAVGLVDASRTVVASDGTRTVAVSGKCVLAADVAAEVAQACERALATLDPEIAPARRVALALAEAAAEPAPADTPAAPTTTTTTMGAPPRLGPPATLDDGSRVPLPPITVRQPTRTETDRRPIYVGLGVIVIALAFYWNRKQREKFTDDGEPVRPPGPAGRDRDGDADADDLHAAAADEPSKQPGEPG